MWPACVKPQKLPQGKMQGVVLSVSCLQQYMVIVESVVQTLLALLQVCLPCRPDRTSMHE